MMMLRPSPSSAMVRAVSSSARSASGRRTGALAQRQLKQCQPQQRAHAATLAVQWAGSRSAAQHMTNRADGTPRRWFSASADGDEGEGQSAQAEAGQSQQKPEEAAGERDGEGSSDTAADAAGAENTEQEDPRDAEIARLSALLEETEAKYMLSLAERENIRKRAADEVATVRKFGVQDFALGVVAAADNLERALETTDAEVGLRRLPPGEVHTTDEVLSAFKGNQLARELYTGVRLMEVELMRFLSKSKIEKFNPLGEKFDPNKHNALMRMPSDDYASGEVALVVKPGYTFHERVMRAADVGVAQ